jgi:membrane protein
MRFPPLLRAIYHFHERDASYYAASISFYLLFALTPFLLLTLSIAALVSADSATYMGAFDEWAKTNLPRHAASKREALVHVFENRSSIGIVGLVWLFLSARKLVNAIEIGLNAMLEIERRKSGVLTTLASVAFIFLAAVLFLASILSSAAIDFATGVDAWFVSADARSIGALVLKTLFGAAVSVALFFAVYRLAPANGLPARDALIAAAAATVLWLAARHVFVWFGAKQLARYQWLYGSIASFLLLLLWAYVFALALLMGACLVRPKA